MMWSHVPVVSSVTLLSFVRLVSGQQNCYYGAGAGFRGPADLVPCNTTSEFSACCRLGDTCLSGNTCYNYATNNVYQYGCTDINYQDASCPQKCGYDPSKSPWIGLEYCTDIQDLDNTWTCLAPESCGCAWKGTYDLQILPSRGCGEMGSTARVALYAPSTLLAYVSLPQTYGGEPTYYSTTTDSNGDFSVISTAQAGYTPDSFTQFTTYREVGPTPVYINAAATASPTSDVSASVYTYTTPPPTSGSVPASSSASAPASTLVTTSSSMKPTTSATKASGTSTPVPASSGLSTGVKVGIGVGVAGGACLLAAIGICWFLLARRKKQNQQPPQYAQAPPMGPYIHGQQPSGWAPFPPPGMPYYVVPASSMSQKDAPLGGVSPAYSPPHSPPPPTELSTEQQRRQMQDGGSIRSSAGSPRLSTSYPITGSPRFHEGPL